MEIISRAVWGARAPRFVSRIPIPTPKLYLHHAAGANLPGGDGLSDADLKRIRSIQNFHMDVRGWSDIAYSFLLDPDGNVFEGRGAGVAGGHTAGQNTVSHAICVMGNYDNQVPSDVLLDRIAELVTHGHERGWWPAVITGGHRDAPGAATSCPGSKLYPLISEINRRTEEDDMALSPKAENFVNSFLAAMEKSGRGTDASRDALMDQMIALVGAPSSAVDPVARSLASRANALLDKIKAALG